MKWVILVIVILSGETLLEREYPVTAETADECIEIGDDLSRAVVTNWAYSRSAGRFYAPWDLLEFEFECKGYSIPTQPVGKQVR